MRVCGIDPGKTGALALIENGTLREVLKMPETPADTFNVLEAWLPDFVALERIELRPTFWVDKKTGEEKRSLLKSSAMLAGAAGELRGMLVALRVAFDEPRPQTWQKALGIPAKSGKAGALKLAQSLFPDAKVFQYAADAVCLAAWAARQKRDVVIVPADATIPIDPNDLPF